jgi:hypothetical protein
VDTRRGERVRAGVRVPGLEALTEQWRGALHVFLPLTDRGIDSLVHRLTDGVYIPVQAKGRSALMGGEVHLVVWADGLADDDALLVAGLIVDGGLGPTMLVVPEGDFKRLAELSQTGGRPFYSMGFGMRPRSDSRWLPWLVPPDRLAERLGITPAMTELVAQKAVAAELAPSWRSAVHGQHPRLFGQHFQPIRECWDLDALLFS